MKLDSIHSGFAAGCEAGLCPAVDVGIKWWATPLVRALPCVYGPSPNQGHSPNQQWIKLTAGRSPASHRGAKPQHKSQMILLASSSYTCPDDCNHSTTGAST